LVKIIIIGFFLISSIFFLLFIQGTIYLTATHLIFIDPEGKREIWVSFEIKNLFTKKRDCADLYATLNQLRPG